MRSKSLIVVAVMFLAGVLSACGPSTVVANPQPPVRSMTVSGTGTVNLTPDIAYINIGVHSEGPSASEVVADNNTKTQEVIDALKGMGVKAEDIRTTNFSIWPSQQYDQTGQSTGTTYMVDNPVYLTVRDISKLGDVLDETIKAGANSINSIQFDVADKTDSLAKARKLAVDNASKQAQELADAAGVKLGAIQTIQYFDTTPGPVFDYGKGGGGAALPAAAAVPINPGQLQLTVSVTLSYELK
jgi:uncharacterized protein YggE